MLIGMLHVLFVESSAELENCVHDFASARTATAFQPSVKASINGSLNFLFTPGKIKLIACKFTARIRCGVGTRAGPVHGQR